MGQLKPGATYIYERSEGIVYAREFGADPKDRIVVGYESGRDYDLHNQIQEDKLWGEIRRAAKTNPALQAELERVIMLYHLTKENKDTVAYHPV